MHNDLITALNTQFSIKRSYNMYIIFLEIYKNMGYSKKIVKCLGLTKDIHCAGEKIK